MNNTIKIACFTVIASFIFMGGCLDKFTTIGFDFHTVGHFTTNALTTTGPQVYGESVVTSTLVQELNDNNTSVDQIEELKLRSVTVSYDGDSSANFDNCETFELWLSADGQPPVMLASKNPIADGLNSVSLDVNSTENLTNYIKSNTFTYTLKGVNSANLPIMNLKADVTFKVKASSKE